MDVFVCYLFVFSFPLLVIAWSSVSLHCLVVCLSIYLFFRRIGSVHVLFCALDDENKDTGAPTADPSFR